MSQISVLSRSIGIQPWPTLDERVVRIHFISKMTVLFWLRQKFLKKIWNINHAPFLILLMSSIYVAKCGWVIVSKRVGHAC